MDKSSSAASIYSMTREKLVEQIINLNYGGLNKETIEWKITVLYLMSGDSYFLL